METNNPKTVLIVEDDAQIAGFVQIGRASCRERV